MTAVKLSQADMILAWMRLHPETGITPWDAFRLLNCTRLAARIWDLRDQGNQINTRMETRDGITYARYLLVAK